MRQNCLNLARGGLFLLLSMAAVLSAAVEKRHPIFHFDSDDIYDILPHVNEKTMVIFDLDDTVFRSSQSLGTASWFYGTVERKLCEGKRWNEAIDEVTALNAAVQCHIDIEPVDARTPELIRQLQDRGVLTIALTTRVGGLQQVTLEQLKTVDVDFSRSPQLGQTFSFGFRPDMRYEKGVLFAGDPHCKGELIESFIEQLRNGHEIERIVFVDDKLRYLLPIEELCRRRGLQFVGLRYSCEDSRRETFCMRVADKQLEMLHALLPSRAERILSHSNAAVPCTRMPAFCNYPQMQVPKGYQLVLIGKAIPDAAAERLLEG